MYASMSEFLSFLEKSGELVRVQERVSTTLEITEIQKRLIQNGGPAILFENVDASNMAMYRNPNKSPPQVKMPILCNLFGTERRIALGMGLTDTSQLREIGEQLAFLRHPELPQSWKEIKELFPLIKRVISMKPKFVKNAPCHEKIYQDNEVDLSILPVQTCWPNEPAPLITWGVVVTKGKQKSSSNGDEMVDTPYNLGIYRLQILSHNKVIVRWLKHRGGAEHYRSWQNTTEKMPISVVIGCDPATLLSAVMPIPENISEYDFSGLLRKKKLELTKCITNPLMIPANAEIVLEGYIDLSEMADEGPYGDHTGFYNDVEKFPVMHITAITTKENPMYLTTFTGKPPDEPSVLGAALNEVFVPLIQQQFPEIVDFWLPPEACSYRIAVVSIKKSYPGHAKRIMMGIWSFLKQFTYTKFIIVVDDDIDVRDWAEVMWAVSTQMDFSRDSVMIDNTPIDYLDFASQESELGSKIGFDATTKIFPETKRNWGRKIMMDKSIVDLVDTKWDDLFKRGK